MAYRDPDDAARRRGEAELERREALAALAVDGQARRAGFPTRALVPVAPSRAPLSPKEVHAALRELPSASRIALHQAFAPRFALSPIAVLAALGGAVAGAFMGGGTAVLAFAVVGGIVATVLDRRPRLGGEARIARELAWVRALPFPLDGYYELLALRCAVPFELLVSVEVPVEDAALVADLVERARVDAPMATDRVDGALRIRAPWPTAPQLVRTLCDEVLVRLHALYPVERVSIRPGV